MPQRPVNHIKPCYAAGCDKKIRRDLLMCWDHWKHVPRRLQDDVYSTLNHWREGGSYLPYQLAILEAQLAIAERDKKSEEVLAHIRHDIDQTVARIAAKEETADAQ